MTSQCELCNAELAESYAGPCPLCGHDPAAGFDDFDGDKTDIVDVAELELANANDANGAFDEPTVEGTMDRAFGAPDVLVGRGPTIETIASKTGAADIDLNELRAVLDEGTYDGIIARGNSASDDAVFSDPDELDPFTGVATQEVQNVAPPSDGPSGDDFLDEKTSAALRVVVPTVHVDGATAALLQPACVLAQAESQAPSDFSVFEQAVFALIDGQRPNARIARRAGISIADLKIALALLVERGAVRLVGHAQPTTGIEHEDQNQDVDLDYLPLPGDDDEDLEVEASEDGGPGSDGVTEDPRDEVVAEPKPDGQQYRPRDVVLYEEASGLERIGDYEGALMKLRAAAKLNPRAAPIFNRMGVVLAIRLGRVSEGMDCVTKAIDLDPNNSTYKNNLMKIMNYVDDEGPKKKESGLMLRLFRK